MLTVVDDQAVPASAIVRVLFGMALRRGELLGLQWGDIDWDERSMFIQRAVKREAGKVVVGSLKSTAGYRKLAVGDKVLTRLPPFTTGHRSTPRTIGFSRPAPEVFWIHQTSITNCNVSANKPVSTSSAHTRPVTGRSPSLPVEVLLRLRFSILRDTLTHESLLSTTPISDG